MNKEKVFLLENIHPSSHTVLEQGGHSIETASESLDQTSLVEKANGLQASALGIRSKTQITRDIIEKLPHLKALGAFCIGTNQIDLSSATENGIPVFNAPYSNTRSVAELVISEMIALSRKYCYLSYQTHQGHWSKTAKGSFEVRGKTVGIVGYGHIGTQVGVLCEALGMNVLYYDVDSKLPLGMAKPCLTLKNLLKESDFVTLHVPETPETKNMITQKELFQMKKGAYLINASRGSVVKIEDLAEALKTHYLGGAAIDVYPSEPRKNGDGFESALQKLDNVILTPHIGGSTEEAQVSIGEEVGAALDRYFRLGDTMGAVNFPQLRAPKISEGNVRLCHIHKNIPGVLGEVNTIFSKYKTNILFQSLGTYNDLGYLMADFSSCESQNDLLDDIKKMNSTVKVRLIESLF